MTEAEQPEATLLEELGFFLEERSGVWVVQEDAGGCYPANLTERVLWKALVEMHQKRQCLHKISEPSGWRPIETAPKNGQCLVWCETDDGGEVMKLQRDVRGNWIYEGEPTYCHSFYINPTRWMPLPPSPSSADEGGSK